MTTTFSDIVTHTRSDLATMVDSDGNLKWCAHNLFTYSEQFDNAAWTKTRASITANAATAPDGTATADKLIANTDNNSHFINNGSFTSGIYTSSVFAKAGEYDYLKLTVNDGGFPGAWFDLTNGVVGTVGAGITASIVSAGSGWYLCSVTNDTAITQAFIEVVNGDNVSTYTGDNSSGIYIWGAHVYRSDLGGMVNNPDRSDSYVPTTSSAVYLPRRKAHRYDSTTAKWNAHNLLTYSEDFTDAAWTKLQASVSLDAVGPDGVVNSAATMTAASGLVSPRLNETATTDPTVNHTGSVFVKKGNYDYAQVFLSNSTTNWVAATMDFTTGTVTKSGAGAGGTLVAANVEDLGDGFYRLSVTGSLASGTTVDIGVLMAASATPTYGSFSLQNWTAAGTETMIIYGAHLYRSDLNGVVANSGNSVSGLYVPTTTTAGTPTLNTTLSFPRQGILHESAARTNLVTYSEDFADASWAKSQIATPALDADGPDGQTNSAVTLVDDNAGGTGSPAISRPVTVATSTKYTFSCFLKADQLSIGVLRIFDFTTPVTTAAYFNLSTGSIGTVDAGFDDAFIEDYGNGWYRCSVVFTTDAADTTGNIQLLPAETDGSIVVNRDGTSSILIYGAQFEVGSTPSSYIPTAGATASRSADTLTVPVANLPSPYAVDGHVALQKTFGDELITNGTFDTDTTGWTAGGGASLSQSSGELVVTSTTAFGRAEQNLGVLTEGAVYQLTVDFISTTGASGKAEIKVNNPLGTFSVSGGASVGAHVITFVGSSSFNTISLGDFGDASAVTVFDNVSVREEGWSAGYINSGTKGAFLASTDTTNLVGTELVTNGTFDTDTSGWTVDAARGTLSWQSGVMRVTNDQATGFPSAQQTISGLTVGRRYRLSALVRGTLARLRVTSTSLDVFSAADITSVPFVEDSLVFTATATTAFVYAYCNQAGNTGDNAEFDNISVKLADEDRSVNANPLTVNGTVTRSAVATGAELVAYSGFSASNYLEQPYNSDLDFGTGDFCVMGWVKGVTSNDAIIHRSLASTDGGLLIQYLSGKLQLYGTADTNFTLAVNATVSLTEWSFFCVLRDAGVAYIYVNGQQLASNPFTTDLSYADTVLRVGERNNPSSSALAGSLALLRISDTAPTAAQIASIYAEESVLFQDNADISDLKLDKASFAMKGRVTYADTGAFPEFVFYDWDGGANEYIDAFVGTNLGTGQPRFRQAENGTLDQAIEANTNYYAAGVNVSFNIASRHGTTFINGAVDGTALTEDTTPVEFPDLSATDLDLAPTFNGFIEEFRMWGGTTGDIGDTGIAEAST